MQQYCFESFNVMVKSMFCLKMSQYIMSTKLYSHLKNTADC